MRYKCALVDGLVDGTGRFFSLSNEDKIQLTLGKGWDEVTSEPCRLQIPTKFCRHETRPGPKSWGQSCDMADGMMCVFIDEPPFGDVMGFENIGTAILTVLFLLLCITFLYVQSFDVHCLVCSILYRAMPAKSSC
jgi:hypothetical protein